MHAGLRQFRGAVAAFALFLQTIAWGIGPAPAPAVVDPFSVICHSDASALSIRRPTTARPHPRMRVITAISAAPQLHPSPPGTTIAAYIKPVRTLAIPRSVDSTRHDTIIGEASLARGPPLFA
jgi:hypothetical protein